MGLVLSILQGFLLVVLALFALGIARWVFGIGQGIVSGASIALLSLPNWVRWLILFPALALSAFILIFTFNVIFWIGDWFGESFVGTAWAWGTTITQAVVIPGTLVTASSVIAPSGRRWTAIVVMLVIWTWLIGTLLDPDTGEFLASGFDVWFYGSLVLAAASAAYAAIKAWVMDPLLRLMELELRTESAVDSPDYCHGCGTKAEASDRFCRVCGAALVKSGARLPRPLATALGVLGGLVVTGGLIGVAVIAFSQDSRPDQLTAAMDAYFVKIDPILTEFNDDRESYNTVARRVDTEARTEISPTRRMRLYTELVNAAKNRHARVQSQLIGLDQALPPLSLAQYHQHQTEVFVLTTRFLNAIQWAYDVSLAEGDRDLAYDRATTLHQQVVETQDQMLEELKSLGLAL